MTSPGSYPRPNEDIHKDYDQDAELIGDAIDNPLYFDSFSAALQNNREADDAANYNYNSSNRYNTSDNTYRYNPYDKNNNTLYDSNNNHNNNNNNNNNNNQSNTTTAAVAPGLSREEEVYNIIHKYAKVDTTTTPAPPSTSTTAYTVSNSTSADRSKGGPSNASRGPSSDPLAHFLSTGSSGTCSLYTTLLLS